MSPPAPATKAKPLSGVIGVLCVTVLIALALTVNVSPVQSAPPGNQL